MPVDREITKPMLGDNQEPTALTWKSSLRTPTASPRGPERSRSRTRSAGVIQSSLRSRTPSPTIKSMSRDTSLRKSSSGKLGVSFGSGADVARIENDYIKNLQQQIYFLELEANYLREQAKKATEMHPRMTAEAERMLTKLRVLQGDADDLQGELRRKDASLELVTDEKYKILARLSLEENDKERMRQQLQDDLAEVKAERDRITLENVRLDNQVERLMAEKDNCSAKLRESQTIITLVKDQLSDASEKQRMTQLSLEDTRSQCIEAHTRAEKVEDHYLNTTQRAHEHQINSCKDELRLLKHQLKEQERQVHDERYLKNKMQDENDQLSKNNLLLRKQIDDLECQILKDQQVNKDLEISQTEDLMKISAMTDNENELKIQLRSLQKELASEKERCNRYFTELKINEEEKSGLESTNNTVKMELAGSGARIGVLEKENMSLRRDKDILTDHVADLQRQLVQRDSVLSESKLRIRELEQDLNLTEAERQMEETTQTEKWREFENLAEGMKKLSRTMAHTTSSTNSLRRSSKFT